MKSLMAHYLQPIAQVRANDGLVAIRCISYARAFNDFCWECTYTNDAIEGIVVRDISPFRFRMLKQVHSLFDFEEDNKNGPVRWVHLSTYKSLPVVSAETGEISNNRPVVVYKTSTSAIFTLRGADIIPHYRDNTALPVSQICPDVIYSVRALVYPDGRLEFIPIELNVDCCNILFASDVLSLPSNNELIQMASEGIEVPPVVASGISLDLCDVSEKAKEADALLRTSGGDVSGSTWFKTFLGQSIVLVPAGTLTSSCSIRDEEWGLYTCDPSVYRSNVVFADVRSGTLIEPEYLENSSVHLSNSGLEKMRLSRVFGKRSFEAYAVTFNDDELTFKGYSQNITLNTCQFKDTARIQIEGSSLEFKALTTALPPVRIKLRNSLEVSTSLSGVQMTLKNSRMTLDSSSFDASELTGDTRANWAIHLRGNTYFQLSDIDASGVMVAIHEFRIQDFKISNLKCKTCDITFESSVSYPELQVSEERDMQVFAPSIRCRDLSLLFHRSDAEGMYLDLRSCHASEISLLAKCDPVIKTLILPAVDVLRISQNLLVRISDKIIFTGDIGKIEVISSNLANNDINCTLEGPVSVKEKLIVASVNC